MLTCLGAFYVVESSLLKVPMTNPIGYKDKAGSVYRHSGAADDREVTWLYDAVAYEAAYVAMVAMMKARVQTASTAPTEPEFDPELSAAARAVLGIA